MGERRRLLALAFVSMVGVSLWALLLPAPFFPAELRLGRRVPLAVAATLVYAIPHVIYHVTHLDSFPRVDAGAQTAVLTFMVAAPIWLLWRIGKGWP